MHSLTCFYKQNVRNTRTAPTTAFDRIAVLTQFSPPLQGGEEKASSLTCAHLSFHDTQLLEIADGHTASNAPDFF